MSRFVLTTLVLALLAAPAGAQRVLVGATGGAKLVQFTGSPSDQGWGAGFGAGAVVSYSVAPRFAVQAEALYADFGKLLLTQEDYLGQTPAGQDSYIRTRDRQLAKYIEVPVLVQYLLPASQDGRVKVHLGAGAATAFRASCTMRTDTEYVSTEDGQVLLRDASDGVCPEDGGGVQLSLLASFGGQYDFARSRIFGHARYTYGISRVAGTDGKLRQITVGVGLAYRF